MGIAEPLSIDPAHVDSSSGLLVIAQAFDGLVASDPRTQQPVPAVAERWDVLEGGTVLLFHLRAEVGYHDGTSLHASDFVFAWNRLADPATHSPFAFLLESVAGYREFHVLHQAAGMTGLEAVDPSTLRVTLTRPWPGFVSLTAHPALSPVPPSAASLDYDAQPIGNGPYALSEPWGIGQPIKLERSDAYWGMPPAIDQLEFDVYPQPEEGWPNFLSGDLDVASVPSALVPEVQSQYGDAGFVTLARLLYCGFNVSLKPFQDARLRRAFSLALDREALAATVYGPVAVPATGIVPPSIPGFDPDVCGSRCTQDLGEAARLAAGLTEQRRNLPLEIIQSEVGQQLSDTLSAQLAAAGFQVKPELLDEETYGARLQQDRQRAFCLVWDADTATQQGMLEPLLGAGSPDNHSNVHAPRIDAALSRGRSATDAASAQQAYGDAERIALDLLPIVPVVWFRSHLAVQPYVRGFRLDPLGLFDVASLDLLPEGAAATPGPSVTP